MEKFSTSSPKSQIVDKKLVRRLQRLQQEITRQDTYQIKVFKKLVEDGVEELLKADNRLLGVTWKQTRTSSAPYYTVIDTEFTPIFKEPTNYDKSILSKKTVDLLGILRKIVVTLPKLAKTLFGENVNISIVVNTNNTHITVKKNDLV